MNYKKVIDRVLRNLGIEDENTRTLLNIRNDISDTIKQVYAKSSYPSSSFCYKVGLDETILESFDDSTYLSNLTVSGDFVYSAINDRLDLVASQTGVVTLVKLNDLASIVVNAEVTNAIAGTTILQCKIYTQQGTEVYSDSQIVTAVATDFTFTPTVPDGQCSEQWYAVITLVSLLNESAINSISYVIKHRHILLPSDAFNITGVTFSDSDKRFLRSSEVSLEEFKSFRVVYQDPETDFPKPAEVMVADSIIFHIDVREDGIHLIWKYEFEGLIDVVYQTLPSDCFNINDTIPVNNSFMDLMVYGATIRGLRRMFKEAETEIRLVGLKSEYADYTNDFKSELKRYSGFTQNYASGRFITPFDYFQDQEMELD